MTKLTFTPAPVGNRFHCTCGGEQFFIAMEGEERPTGPVDNIECTACHEMFCVEIKSLITNE